METFIKILPIIVVVLVVFLVREGFSFYKYLKNCQLLDWTSEYFDPKQRSALLRFAAGDEDTD